MMHGEIYAITTKGRSVDNIASRFYIASLKGLEDILMCQYPLLCADALWHAGSHQIRTCSSIKKINTRLVSYSREVADAASRKVYVAADITTSGKMMEPAGDMTYEAAFEMYREQIEILKNAGVDLIVAETMINIEETLAAVDAASTVCQLPIMCTMTVDADGSIFSGGNAIEAAVSLEAAGADAVGVNCSVGPDQLISVIRNIRENVSIPVIAKPNAGMPFIDDQGNAVYSMKAPDFAKHIKALIDAGAGIVGGCCGTTPEYIKEVATILER